MNVRGALVVPRPVVGIHCTKGKAKQILNRDDDKTRAFLTK